MSSTPTPHAVYLIHSASFLGRTELNVDAGDGPLHGHAVCLAALPDLGPHAAAHHHLLAGVEGHALLLQADVGRVVHHLKLVIAPEVLARGLVVTVYTGDLHENTQLVV